MIVRRFVPGRAAPAAVDGEASTTGEAVTGAGDEASVADGTAGDTWLMVADRSPWCLRARCAKCRGPIARRIDADKTPLIQQVDASRSARVDVEAE